jgi:hypothetical protein
VDEEDSPSTPELSLARKPCNNCGKTGLYWGQVSGKWRLFERGGAPHRCATDNTPVSPSRPTQAQRSAPRAEVPYRASDEAEAAITLYTSLTPHDLIKALYKVTIDAEKFNPDGWKWDDAQALSNIASFLAEHLDPPPRRSRVPEVPDGMY